MFYISPIHAITDCSRFMAESSADVHYFFYFQNVDYEISFDHTHNGNGVQSVASVKYGPNQEAKIDIDMKKESMKPLKGSAEVTIAIPGRVFGFKETLEEKNTKEYHHDLILNLDKYDTVKIMSVYTMMPRHEVTADIITPWLKPIHLEGHLNPSLQNFQSHGQVVYDSNTYSSQVDWSHNGNQRNFKGEGTFDLNYPIRHIIVKGGIGNKGSAYNANINTRWDADNDQSRKFITSGELVLSTGKPSFQIKSQWWPNRYMELSGKFKNDKMGWWHPNRELEGNLKLKTSFDNIEDISIAFKHDQNAEETQTHAELSWAQGQKIDADFNLKLLSGWNKVDSSIAIRTPFQLSVAQYNLEYDYNGNSLSATTKAMWNDHQMALTVSGNADLDACIVDGSATFTSPFHRFERISVSAKHRPERYHTEAEISWARGQTVKAVFDVDHEGRAYFTNNGELTITTPFRGYKTNKLTWNHNYDRGGIKLHADVSQERIKTSFDLEGQVKITNKRNYYMFSTKFSCPYMDELKDLSLSFEHENNPRSWDNCKTSSKVQWAREQVITLEHNIDVKSTSAESEIKFTSPFSGYKVITLNTNGKKDGEKYTFHKELTFDKNKKVTLYGSWTHNGPIYDGELRFTSPFKPVERLLLTSSQTNTQGTWNTNVAFEYAPDKKMELSNKFGISRSYTWGIDIKTPCPYFQSFVIDFDHSGNARDFNTKAEFELIPTLDSKVSVNLDMDTKSLYDINGKLMIKTPFEDYKYFHTEISHKKTGKNKYLTSFTSECTHNKFTLSHNMTVDMWRSYSCHTEVEYTHGQKIVSDFHLAKEPKFSVGVKLRTPFRTFSTFSTSFSHEGTPMDFINNAELQWQPGNNKFTSKVEFEYTHNSVKGGVTVTTPYTDYDTLSVNFNHQGSLKNFNSDGSVVVGQIRTSGRVSFKLQGTKLELTTSLQTPIPNVETITITLNHEGDLSAWNNNFELSYANRKYTTGTEYDTTKKGFNAKFELKTPHKLIKNLVINLDHKGKWKNFKSSVSINYNGNRYTGNFDLKINNKVVKGGAILKTPKPYAISFIHKGTRWDFSNSAKINLAGDKYHGNSEFMKKGQTYTGSASVSIPKEYRVSFTHEGGLSDFTNTAELKAHRDTYNAGSELHLNGNNAKINVFVKVPEEYGFNIEHDFNMNRRGWRLSEKIDVTFKDIKHSTDTSINTQGLFSLSTAMNGPQYDITLNANQEAKGITGNGQFNIMGKSYSGTTEFRKQGNTVRGSGSINIPQEYGFSFTHTGTSKNFRNNGDIKIDGTSFTGNSEFKIQDSTISGSAMVNAPHPYGISFSHRGNPSDFINNVEITYRGRRFHGNSEFKMSGRSVSGSASVKTPKEYGISFNHGGSLNDFSTTAETNYEGQKFSVIGAFKKDVSGIQTSGSITTPYENYNKFGFNLNHGNTRHGFETNGKVTTTMRGYDEFGFNLKHSNHRGDISSSLNVVTPFHGYDNFAVEVSHQGTKQNFQYMTTVMTPFREMRTGKLSINHQGHGSDFTTIGFVEYDGKKFEGQAKFKKTGTWFEDDHEGSLTIKTPYDSIRDAEFRLENKKTSRAWNGKLEATHNSAKYIDADYNINNGDVKSLEINLRQPKRISANANYNRHGGHQNGDAKFDWDSSSYGVNFGLKNEDTEKEISLSATLPYRTVGFTTGYQLSDGQFSHKGELMWDTDPSKKFNYEIEGKSNSRGNRCMKDGHVIIKSKHVNFDGTFSCKCTPGRRKEMELKLQDFTIKTDTTTREPGLRNFQSTFTVQHPSLRKVRLNYIFYYIDFK